MILKIWQRQLIKDFTYTFLSFFAGFAFLFIVIDYASGTATWRQLPGTTPAMAWVRYYLSEVVVYGEILVPFAALFATIRTMLRLNDTHELLALRSAGLSLKQITSPLLIWGLLLSLLLAWSNEAWRPTAEGFLHDVEGARRQAKYKHGEWITAHNVPTTEGGNVFYLNFNDGEGSFDEAYWVQRSGTVVKMRHLFPFLSPPTAQWVEILRRNEEGDLVLAESHAELALERLAIVPEALRNAALQPSLLSLSMLWRQAALSDPRQSIKEASLVTLSYKRAGLPWLALLAVAAPLPWCVAHRRLRRSTALYGFSLFALVALYLILDAFGVLGSRQIIAPLPAIAGPLLLAYGAVLLVYWRMR